MAPHKLALIFAIIAEVIGTTALQQSQQFTKLLPSVAVIIFYGLSFYLLSIALRSMPVGVVYAIWSGLGIALIAIVGFVFLGQVLDLAALIGIGLILAGVMVIQLLSGSGHS